jgi:hypothetical protein
MSKTVLEKYVSRGWLDEKHGRFSKQDRLLALKLLIKACFESEAFSSGVRDLSIPRVDGGKKSSLNLIKIEAIRRFNLALGSMGPKGGKIVQKIVFENKEFETKNKKDEREVRRLFREAVDCLVLYYIKKRREK